MNAYELENQCEYPRCSALYTYELEIYEQWFRFCGHHAHHILEIANKRLAN